MATSSTRKARKPSRPKQKRPTKAQRAALERRTRQRRTIATVLVVALLATVAYAVIRSGDASDGGTPSAAGRVSIERAPDAGPLVQGDEMPSFSAPGIDGSDVSWSAGEPTVVAVWAPWCPHCQKELPVVADVAAEFPEVELVSVATSIGDQPSEYTPQSYMQEKGLSFPVALDDAEDTLGRGLGIEGFPTLYVVDADGVVRGSASGEPSEEDLRTLIGSVA